MSQVAPPDPRQTVGQKGWYAMSDPNIYQDDDADDSEQSKPDPVRAQLKRVEAENKTLKAESVKAVEAIRKLAFLEAKVDINSPAAKYFLKAYDGELSVEAISVAAQEANLLADPSKDPVVEAEKAAASRVVEAGRVNENAGKPLDINARIAAAKTPGELDQILAEGNAQSK